MDGSPLLNSIALKPEWPLPITMTTLCFLSNLLRWSSLKYVHAYNSAFFVRLFTLYKGSQALLSNHAWTSIFSVMDVFQSIEHNKGKKTVP